MHRQILHGDVLEKLKEIHNESIDCIISSPPYWSLKDYGVDGQMGLEPDFRDYLKIMSNIMTELKRVLKSTGTCWINLGDSYGTNKGYDGKNTSFITRKPIKNLEKSRIGIPERFYINCIDDGWIARNHIPWYKSNSMPSSVKDRFTNKWESIFFFAKNKEYFFNLDAVREKTITELKPFNIRVRENITGHAQAKLGDKSWTATEEEMAKYNKDGTKKYEKGSNVGRLHKDRNSNKQDNTLGSDGKPKATYKGFNDRWKTKEQLLRETGMSKNGGKGSTLGNRKYTEQSISRINSNGTNIETGESLNHPKGKNPGDVFFINPKPFTAAHFATFPVELPLKILKCACSPNGIVLDPFFGAGTVGVAAEMLGFQWCGIEFDLYQGI